MRVGDGKMQVQDNVKLSTKTTFHVGGYTKKLYLPENEKELIHIAAELYEREGKVYLLSGGSNLLINDQREFESVISMKEACTELLDRGNGRFYIGASNRIQKVISFLNEHGHGGFEELIGLPAMFGGIVCMNAGIGGENSPLFTISEFIEYVKVYDLKQKIVKEIRGNECGFSHRTSLFQNGKYVILGAEILCKAVEIEKLEKKKKDRLDFCKNNFEYGKGCFGSCFSRCNGKLLRLISILYPKNTNGIHFGKNTCNWLVNGGEGTFKEAYDIIRTSEKIHGLLHQDIMCEVVIWK